MGLLSTDELTLATLANEPEGTTTGCPLSRLRTVATRETGRLSRQVELTVAIQQFVTDGLVEQTAGPDEERLVLTPSGRDRANAVLDDLVSREITVVDNTGEQTLTVGEAATEFECSPVEIAAACSADGTYYHRDEAIEYDLLGRDEATARFERALDRVSDRDNGAAVVVTGPGGIGKTTFVEAMLDRTASSVTVHSARCRETPEVGFQPLRDIFAGLDGESFPVIGVEAEDADVYERQQAGLFHDVTERLAPDNEQTRVLFLDDVSLADGATWDYLEYLAGRLADLPLVLILAHRSGTLPRPVFGTDAETGGTGPGEGHIEPTRIELSGLTREETERLIEQVLDRRGVPTAFADAVYDRTGGNPLFVETTVEALLESQQLDPEFQWYPEHAGDIDLPDAVGETIIRQLDILDDDAKTVLEWAAIAGESIPQPVLVTVCDLPERRTRALVETLVEAGLFDRPSGSIERVTFQSNVVREAILDVIEDGRADRHVTVADAFVECAGTDDIDEREFAATIAYQYEQGGNVDDAISWYERAAERATESYAHETAIEHYMHVLDLARSVDDYGTLCETGLEIATVALTTSDYDRAARYVQFVEETDETGSFAAQVR